MAKYRRPTDKIISYCTQMVDQGYNPEAFITALGASNTFNYPELGDAVLPLIKDQKDKLRPSFFWQMMVTTLDWSRKNVPEYLFTQTKRKLRHDRYRTVFLFSYNQDSFSFCFNGPIFLCRTVRTVEDDWRERCAGRTAQDDGVGVHPPRLQSHRARHTPHRRPRQHQGTLIRLLNQIDQILSTTPTSDTSATCRQGHTTLMVQLIEPYLKIRNLPSFIQFRRISSTCPVLMR